MRTTTVGNGRPAGTAAGHSGVCGQAGWCVEHEACEWTFSSVGMHESYVGSVCG